MPHSSIGNEPNLVEFFKNSKHIKRLGSGSDGNVSLWKHNNGKIVAVKSPAAFDIAIQNVYIEIENLKKISASGKHPNTVTMLGYLDNWQSNRPALMLEAADYGDLISYNELADLKCNSNRRPEMTVWKILFDMTKGLDFIHNQLGETHMHGDMKPENVLVFHPKGAPKEDFPLLPTCKISDFGRMSVYNPNSTRTFNGTIEYAPAKQERDKATPAIDIWGIASTIAVIVFQWLPLESEEAYIKRYNLEHRFGRMLIPGRAFDHEHHGLRLPVYYPLNATREQQEALGIPGANRVDPYSDQLNFWYEVCYNTDTELRITADLLQKRLIPVAECNIEIWKNKWLMRQAADRKATIEINMALRAKGLREIGLKPYQTGLTIVYDT